MSRGLLAAAWVCTVAVAVAACSGASATSPTGASREQSSAATATPTPTTASSAPAAVATPVDGECWDYPAMDHWVLEDNAAAKRVDCTQEHTAQTVWLGELPATVTENPFSVMDGIQAAYPTADGDVDLDRATAAEQASYEAMGELLSPAFAECRKALDRRSGAMAVAGLHQYSLLATDITGPGADAWAAGARWIRCNAAAESPDGDPSEATRLMTLPVSIDGVLMSEAGMQFRKCFSVSKKTGRERTADCRTEAADTMWLHITEAIPQPRGNQWGGIDKAIVVARTLCVRAVQSLQPTRTASQLIDQLGVWGFHEAKDGTITPGFRKSTWGKPNSFFGCALRTPYFIAPTGTPA